MDILAILAIIGGIVGIIAGIVQVVDCFQKQREKRFQAPPIVSDQTSLPVSNLLIGEKSNLTQLREKLDLYFSEGELETLCFDLRINYENLPGQTKADKVRELILKMERNQSLAELIQLCRQQRPKVEWPDIVDVTTFQPESQSSTLIPHNLPRPSNFIGREVEKARIHAALLSSETYLISIDGIGGIGKSSLALAVAYECLEERSQSTKPQTASFSGFIWVSAKDRELTFNALLDTIALTLDYPGIAQQPQANKQMAVEKLLRNNNCLLIIDNFETVIDKEVRSFIRSLPAPTKALITTREQNLYWTQTNSLQGLSQTEAVTLIRDEGRRLGLTGVTQAEDAVLLPLYQTTDGAPLAIRWAIGQIKQRGQALESVLRSLQSGDGEIFERLFLQAWQYLSEEAKNVFMSLTVFTTSASYESIREINQMADKIFEGGLGMLVEMSLVDPSDDLLINQRRYTLHPLSRAFGREKLNNHADKEQIFIQNQALYYRQALEKHGGLWNRDGFVFIETELPNILTLLDWAFAGNHVTTCLDLYRGIAFCLVNRGYWDYALDLGYRLIEQVTLISDDLLDEVMHYREWPIGWILRHRGEYQAAEKEITLTLEYYQNAGKQKRVALIKRDLARLHHEMGDLEVAERLLKEALEVHSDTDNKRAIYRVTANLAAVKLDQGDLDQAWELCQGILPEVSIFEDPGRLAHVYSVMGHITYQRNNFVDSQNYWERALVNARNTHRFDGIANNAYDLARLKMLNAEGKEEAKSLLEEALEAYSKLGMVNKATEVENAIMDLTA